MLHRAVVPAFAALLVAPPVDAAPRVLAPLTIDARDALRDRVAAVTVTVRRRRPAPKGTWTPGRDAATGNGWLAVTRRVVTSSLLVEGWPAGPDDAVEVRAADGRWRPAAVGLADARLGLAVLDVPGLSVPGAPPKPPEKDAIHPGRPLFAVAAPGAPLWRYEIGARGAGTQAYYWNVLGIAPLGTPLFDAQARVVTLVGLHGTGHALALPTSALHDLFDRSLAWLP